MADPLADLLRSTADPTYGVTPAGFVPKPVARLLDERLAAARVLFGATVDLTSGSVLRKLCELMALSDARLWEQQHELWRSTFVTMATGEALSALGAEIGLPRPLLRATTTVSVALAADLPAGMPVLDLPLGTRLATPSGVDFFTTQRAVLTNAARRVDVPVRAFRPGPDGDVDPAVGADQRLDRFSTDDFRSQAARSLPTGTVIIEHTVAATGGARLLDDESYRQLLVDHPRNLWSADSLRLAALRVPGVRRAAVRDGYGGLDVDQAMFGSMTFFERLFSAERDFGSPYFVTVLIAPGDGALWDGPNGLLAQVRTALDTVRPVGILPQITPVSEVFVGVEAELYVDGVPTPELDALRERIGARLTRYVSALDIGEPARHSEFVWAVMEEPGVVDVKNLRLRRSPPADPTSAAAVDVLAPATDVAVGEAQIATFVLEPTRVVIR